MLTITFKQSSSKNYSQAIDIAKRFDNISRDSKGVMIKVVEPDFIRVQPDLMELVEVCHKWVHFIFIYNNIKVQPYLFVRQLEVIKDCYTVMLRNDLKTKYHCYIHPYVEGWGCKHLCSIKKHLTKSYFYKGNHFWYNYGQFIDANTWEIDKDQVKAVLQKARSK